MTTLLKKIARGWFDILKSGGFLSYLVWLFTATLVALSIQSSFKVLKYATNGDLKRDIVWIQSWFKVNVDLDGDNYKENKH